MSNINYSVKSRCQGCIALQTGKEFSCLFGLPLKCEVTEAGEQVAPAPNDVKCYKPKTAGDLKSATILMKQKLNKKENA